MGMGGITFKFITLSWCPIARKIKFRFAYLDKKSFIMRSDDVFKSSRYIIEEALDNIHPGKCCTKLFFLNLVNIHSILCKAPLYPVSLSLFVHRLPPLFVTCLRTGTMSSYPS